MQTFFIPHKKYQVKPHSSPWFSAACAAVPPLFNGPEVLSSASDEAKLFAENFSLNSNLDVSGVS